MMTAAPIRPASPRVTLLVHLVDDLRQAILCGDLGAARIAHEAVGRLLGSDATRLTPSLDDVPALAADRRRS